PEDGGLTRSAVRAGLWALLRRRLVTNDHFDVIRMGEEGRGSRVEDRGSTAGKHDFRSSILDPRSSIRRARLRPEGRWSVVSWGQPDPETYAVFQTSLLLKPYAIVARELPPIHSCP